MTGERNFMRAVLETLAYADIFDQPLTLRELHRYLHGCRISLPEFKVRLEHLANGNAPVIQTGAWYALKGRSDLARIRSRREKQAEQFWEPAVRYGKRIAKMPFVRMVALTGALAVRNADSQADFDYLIVSAPGRIWTSRLFVVGLVKWAARMGVELCPNYFLSEHSLSLGDRSIFTAHELTQMVPLAGAGVYSDMRRANSWTEEILPNAAGPPMTSVDIYTRHPALQAAELPITGPLGDRLEKWEMDRKIIKFSRGQELTDETRFSGERVQGHFNRYRLKTLEEFENRLENLSNGS